MGERGLPTVQALSEAARTQGKGGGERAKRPLETRTPKPKNMIREVRWKGGCSSLAVRGWWVWINSYGVEISIAGDVRKMVCVCFNYSHIALI